MNSAESGFAGSSITVLRQLTPLHTVPIPFLDQSYITARVVGFFFGCQKPFFPSSSFIVLVTKSNRSITAIRHSSFSFHSNKSLHPSTFSCRPPSREPLPSRTSDGRDLQKCSAVGNFSGKVLRGASCLVNCYGTEGSMDTGLVTIARVMKVTNAIGSIIYP